jgi:chromosome partitioning protein
MLAVSLQQDVSFRAAIKMHVGRLPSCRYQATNLSSSCFRLGAFLSYGGCYVSAEKPQDRSSMGAIIAIVSQKGGVGKSSIARSLAREAAAAELAVKLADLDTQQGTCLDWVRDRNAAGVEPTVSVESYPSVKAALVIAPQVDLLIVDGPARTSAGTLELAQVADLVVQPSGPSVDDLRPAVREFRALERAGVPTSRLVIFLNCVGSDAEEIDARAFVEDAGFITLPGALPERVGYRTALNSGRAMTETVYKALNMKAASMLQAIIERAAG